VEPAAAEPRAPRRTQSHDTRIADEVECSVFAPAAPRRGQDILVQALIHKTEQLVQAAAMAAAIDPQANRKGRRKLRARIARGARVQMLLDIPALAVG
jgi:hypothetical protein